MSDLFFSYVAVFPDVSKSLGEYNPITSNKLLSKTPKNNTQTVKKNKPKLSFKSVLRKLKMAQESGYNLTCHLQI